MATHARTSFNFAARFLPAAERRSAIDLYAFFRTLDDLVDDARPEQTNVIVTELDAWRDWLTTDRRGSGPREPLASNLARVIDSHTIPTEIFLHMLDGLESDLGGREIESDTELQAYCYQVASTVGYAMAHVLGATSPQALSAAEHLGAAMQLTNVLRDVGEDLDSGRVYLPRQTLDHHGLCREDLLRMQHDGGPDERFQALMRAYIAQARAMYDASMAGIWRLPGDCRFPILVAARLYCKLLSIIERNGYDTLRLRVATTRRDKLQGAITGWAITTSWRFGRHPQALSMVTSPTSSALDLGSD
ncbi:MAG: squalene/phytoene synthase family protein [Chloroflexota bacterium]|nr:squalene/phytoene synthase family protein [Chloroflexota bacterium]